MTETKGSHVQEALRAAALGAAVGAARAYSSRRHEPDEATLDEHDEHDESPEAEEDEQDVRDEHEEQEQETHPEPEPERERSSSASRGDVRSAVADARTALRDLRGVDAESVSSATPAGDGWVIGLEVVEVRRIPESTDVMATYEVEVDGDGGVRRFERVRRYHRSEAARGGGA